MLDIGDQGGIYISESWNVLGILGSPRRGGNSETLLDAALDGAAAAGGSVSKLVLNELDIKPCQNCGRCQKSGECHIRDDMTRVRAEVAAASRIILAAPIYFTSVPAQTKAMVDRAQPEWVRKYVLGKSPEKTARVGAFICVGGQAKGQSFFACAERVIKVWFLVQDIAYKQGLFFPGIDKMGDARGNPDALAQCAHLGRNLRSEI